MKKTLIVLMLFAIVPAIAFADGNHITIGLSKLMSHPALDRIEEGIKDYLATTGYRDQIKYNDQNANGELTQAALIAQIFKDADTDLNVAIATPTAQAISNLIQDKPLVYATVTDPDAAGLSDLPYVCGTSDMVPIESHLEILMELKPIKHLGIVYTSGETNAVAVLEKMTALAKEKGIEVISAGVTNSSEVRVAAESIIDRVDAMYVSTDNVVISAIASLSDVCFNHKVPLFSADTTSSYDTDVLIAGGFDYYKSGILTGELIEKVLDGTKPEDIGVQYLSTADLEIYVNLDVAEAIGIEIPENVLSNASIIIKDGSVL